MRTLILLVITSLHFFVCAFKLYNPDIIHVSSKEELQKALDNAKPGQTILLASGYYTGQFKIPANVNGTEQKRIILRGGKDAVLETGDHQKGTALYFEGNAYWKLEGFTIKNSKKALRSMVYQYSTLAKRAFTSEGLVPIIFFRTVLLQIPACLLLVLAKVVILVQQNQTGQNIQGDYQTHAIII
jgi:hypothetical protein